MSVARINLKNIDYFKFRKLVIDGNRDDYNACSKEVKAFCDSVQTFNFRDEEFDDESDRRRFTELVDYYRQILASKRIDPTDVRIKSGWWGDHKNAYSAGKLKPAILKDTLLKKAKDWATRHSSPHEYIDSLSEKIEGPGLYVFKHKDHDCFQYVGRADKVFPRCAEKLKSSFEATVQEPLAALIIISMSTDWDFYFSPIEENDDEGILRILENDLILKHDSIWPHGLNFRLHIDSLLEVSEFRKSCLRHNWPPAATVPDADEIDMKRLRKMLASCGTDQLVVAELPPVVTKKTPKKAKPKPPFVLPGEPEPRPELSPEHVTLSDEELEELPERPGSGLSLASSSTYVVETVPAQDADASSPASDKTYVVTSRPASSGSEGKPSAPKEKSTTRGRPTSTSKGDSKKQEARKSYTSPTKGQSRTAFSGEPQSKTTAKQPKKSPAKDAAQENGQKDGDSGMEEDPEAQADGAAESTLVEPEDAVDHAASLSSLSSNEQPANEEPPPKKSSERPRTLATKAPSSAMSPRIVRTRHSAEYKDHKGPAGKGDKPRPSSGSKPKVDKSRLPVAGSQGTSSPRR